MATRAKRVWITGFVVAACIATLLACQPTCLIFNAWLRDRHDQTKTPSGFTDDASRLNQTGVTEVWPIPEQSAVAEAQLQLLFARARSEKIGISIAGARHSMGGHTICPDGIVIDMLPFQRMEFNAPNKILRVGAGARWKDIVPFLDARGMSVAIMQSNNDFSVGGSLSVNCHGWQCRRPPIADSVVSFRLMKADGAIVTCSRTENKELFSLVLGGYGLFGVILDAELRVVPNERYRAEADVLLASKYAEVYQANVDDTAGMAYGRLCVVPGEKFLKEAILTVFRKAPCDVREIPPLKGLDYATLRREVFRAQIGSKSGKELRWKAEKKLGETAGGKLYSRNQLFNEPAEVYQDQNSDRTDILHEYFVPCRRLEEFLAHARRIVPQHPVDLLNVTVREVREDKDAFLCYADQDMFALVMLFNQPRTPAADEQMQTFTRAMIDAALECGGRYYLPYRLHADPEQFRRAYPQADQFFGRKREHDPNGIFRNQFYLKYGNP